MKYKRNDIVIKLFGIQIKNIRKQKGISQEELAYRTDLELSQIGRIERGVINTSISNLFLIAEALEVAPNELLNFSLKIKKSSPR